MNCSLCQSAKHKIFAKVESFGYPLTYYQCANCGLVFQDLEESKASDPGFYQETYRKIYQAHEYPTDKDLWVQHQRAENLVSLLTSHNSIRPARVLDIGASTGVLLKEISDAFNCAVVGVEPGDAYRHYAAEQGIDMLPSIEAVIEESLPKFDLVSMMHVLEHLPDPVGTLRMIRTHLLTEDGRLVVEVPNFYAHDSYELAHLTCFTPHTLQQTLRHAGFEVMHIHRHGVPRSNLLKLYITVIAKPIAEPLDLPGVNSEYCVRLKRKLAMSVRRFVQKVLPSQAWLPLPGERES
jgi:2-polyprenyl-3-methyl-5-hydroxy-6-metoxy-1,4-benzoquinol methylase